MTAYSATKRARYKRVLDRFYGTDAWWEIVARRVTSNQTKEMRGELLELYLTQLRTLWKHAEIQLEVCKANSRLYHMVFAYDHHAAGSIAQGAKRFGGDLDLFDGTAHAPRPKRRS